MAIERKRGRDRQGYTVWIGNILFGVGLGLAACVPTATPPSTHTAALPTTISTPAELPATPTTFNMVKASTQPTISLLPTHTAAPPPAISTPTEMPAISTPIDTAEAPAQFTATTLPANTVIFGGPAPAGIYDCHETEFGGIWRSEVITLNADGSSIYVYDPPFAYTATGTWSYTPSTQEVSFTNFSWFVAAYISPNELQASQYLETPGFEIGLRCLRR